MARLSAGSQIAKLRAQIKNLEQKDKRFKSRKQSKALTKIVALAKLSELTIAQIQAALGKQRGGRGRGGKTTEATLAAKSARRRSKLAGRKIAPKYRNPANKRETWAGRGRAPKWAADLKTAGKLDSALIR
jgi:DNA-binding protein H-NS